MYFYRSNLQGITRRYNSDLPDVSRSLLGHLHGCIDSLYKNDAGVEESYIQHRVLAVVMDNMRLHFFHKDNKNDRETRRKEFLKFIGSEPYKSAIAAFDPKKSGRWEWRLPISLIQKKDFDKLDKIVHDDRKFNRLCGIDKRISKIFR